MNAEKSRPDWETRVARSVSDDTYIEAESAATVTTAAAVLPDNYLEQVTLRMLQDMLAEATASYWLRRADTLAEAGRLRPDDYLGGATFGSVTARYDRITLQAEQCRVHATLFDHAEVDAGLLVELLGWESAAIIAYDQGAGHKAVA